MINNVTLVGRITKEPELRYTPQNKAVATFTLAVNRAFKNANGEREADFINCVIWGQQAENLAKFAKKGALIGITGRIQTRNYENQQGQKVYVTEVVAENFQMLESNKAQGQQASKPQAQIKKPQAPDPFKTPAADPFSGGKPMEINDDQLPF
ncbi:single-stranded binding protein [Lactococcus phage Q33]|uniref:Single-stranded DNA-binding protein n=2 Tax=root TaxID=1 RepID=Q0ILF5_9CAUD|nr:single strand DNA binding protein [Lactococcus phage Q33]AAR14307.1 ORF152 [Lactococcus phage Q33]AFV51036.1 single-stranded binding protein [Lactococcus phage Q33]